MKNKEEPSVNSRRGNTCEQADLNRSDCVGPQTTGSLSRPGRTVAARTEQPALSDFSELLMERIVDPANMETAWKNVRANRGAPGPDGITIAEFPDWLRPRWDEIRQQLLDGTYRPAPVRRVAIDKPDGSGQRLLGIPNQSDQEPRRFLRPVRVPRVLVRGRQRDDSGLGEVDSEIQAPHSRNHRSESRHLDDAPLRFIAKLRAWMDGLLRSGLATETVRPAGPVDSSSDSDVLLETMAQTETASRNADPTRGPTPSGDSSCSHSQGPVAYGENHCQRCRYDERMAC